MNPSVKSVGVTGFCLEAHLQRARECHWILAEEGASVLAAVLNRVVFRWSPTIVSLGDVVVTEVESASVTF